MIKENRNSIRTVLIFIYIGMTLLLIPWLPIAVWSLVILADPIRELSATAIIIEKVIPFLVTVYPLFFAHGAVLSWRALRLGRATIYVIARALYPFLIILLALFIAVISLLVENV